MAYSDSIISDYNVLSDPDESLQRQVMSIISSYNSAWDVLTELIQNSVDAINQRAAIDGAGYAGIINITIDKDQNIIKVEDNGIGIPHGQRNKMILPGGSLKVQGNTYGHKGLGFTYCAHIAESIEVETCDISTNTIDHWKFSGGFDWIVDRTNNTSVEDGIALTIRTLHDAGTTVKIKLAIDHYEENIANAAVIDKFFDWATDRSLLSFVLRTRTAIGQTSIFFGETPLVNITVNVEIQPNNENFIVPYEFFDFRNLPPFNQQVYQRATEYCTNVYLPPTHPNKIHHGIYHVFDQDIANPGQPLKVGRHRGGVQFKVFLYACGKDNLSAALRTYDERLDNEWHDLSITTDAHLSIAGMPCGTSLDSWTKFGHHEQRYFAIIDTELRFGTVLDAGRKTISRHYVDLLLEKTISMAKNTSYFGTASFHQMSMQLHTSSAIPPQRGPIAYIQAWNLLPPLVTSDLLFSKLPSDELGTYVLFSELVGMKFIPGYKLKYVSGGAVYDSAFGFKLDLANPASKNQTAGGVCTFGVGNALIQQYGAINYTWMNEASGQEHLVSEFKVTADELLRDVQKRRSEKNYRDINILVCISFDQNLIGQLGGSIVPVSDAARKLSGVTHHLHYGGHTINVICLKAIIDKLVALNQLSP